MILVGLGIGIALIVIGIILDSVCYDGFGCYLIAALIIIASLTGLGITGSGLIEARTVDERLAMYEEENTRIEEQIADIVTQYQEYETNIFTEVKPESAMTLVSLYPELKSDTLVRSQIELYTANNVKIKELREEKIKARVYRWWLYFGG